MNARHSYTKAVEAFNKHDPEAFAAFYAADAEVYDPSYPRALKGRDAIERDVADFIRAFPDARFTLRAELESDELTAGEYTVSGTHRGPIVLADGEIAATGKALSGSGAVFSRRNAQGEIVEESRYYDVAGWLAQLGLSTEQR